MSQDLSVSAYVRYALSMMSDRTFLSSVECINFKSGTITIRPGYWKCFVVFVKKQYQLNNVAYVLRTLKNLFIERFVQCDANKMKDYFIGKLRRSYFSFSGILNYISTHSGRPFKKHKLFLQLRKKSYFERKAQLHDKYLKSLSATAPSQKMDDEVPEIFETLESRSESPVSSQEFEEIEQKLSQSSNEDQLSNQSLELEEFCQLDHIHDEMICNAPPETRTLFDPEAKAPVLNTIHASKGYTTVDVQDSGRQIEYIGSTPMSERTITTTTTKVTPDGFSTSSSKTEVITEMFHQGSWK